MNRFSYVPKIEDISSATVFDSKERPSIIGNDNFSGMLGEAYHKEEIWRGVCSSFGCDEEEYKKDPIGKELWIRCDNVFAWSVPSLKGKYLEVEHSDELFFKILAFVKDSLGPFEGDNSWICELDTSQVEPEETALCKYGIFHTCLPFGISTHTKQPTVLELLGNIVSVGGKTLDSVDERWVWLVEHFWSRYENVQRPLINQTIKLVFLEATWTNVFAPHIHVPFYL